MSSGRPSRRAASPDDAALGQGVLAGGGLVGDDDAGATPSGGQRARIALARALLVRPWVLVLDESTAHLDDTGDAELATVLQEEGRTILVIAHRPATTRRADRIAVLEDGITEEGTWAELTSRPGSALNLIPSSTTPSEHGLRPGNRTSDA